MKHSVEDIRNILSTCIPEGLIVPEHTSTGHFYRHVPTNQLFSSVTTKCGILDAPHLKKWAAKLAIESFVDAVTRDPGIMEDRERTEAVKISSMLKHQDTFEDAGEVGTKGHKIVESYLLQWMETGKRPDDIRTFIKEDDARVFAIARSAEMFCKEWNVVPVASEMFVASVKHKFAGTLDSLMMILRTDVKGDGTCSHNHTFLNLSKSNPNKVKCAVCGLKGEFELCLVDWKTSNSIDKVEYAMQTTAYWKALYEITKLKPKHIFIVRLDKAHAKYEVRRVPDIPTTFKAFCDTAKVYDWLNNKQDKLISATPKERIQLIYE